MSALIVRPARLAVIGFLRAAEPRKLAAIEPARQAVETWRIIPPPDLRLSAMDPGEANLFLRNIWSYVELDPLTMLPIKAHWTV